MGVVSLEESNSQLQGLANGHEIATVRSRVMARKTRYVNRGFERDTTMRLPIQEHHRTVLLQQH
jgi:hypothetical protein